MKQKKAKSSMRATGEHAYFAASNSKSGFYSYYSGCFDRKEIGAVYAIKGGPGTGKSRFMREVANCAKEKGWRVETVYCSSDPESLDGIVLWKEREGIAFLDATAPHVYEPRRVGFRENLINLGAFWDASLLRARSEEIEALDQKKKSAYQRAYRYLSAYGAVAENRDAMLAPYYRERAIAAFAAKLLQGLPNGDAFLPQVALMRSVGMRGAVAFDTYLSQASRIFLIEDCRGCAFRLTEALYRCIAEKKLRVRVSKDPILPERVDGLFLCESGYAFVVAEKSECAYPFKQISTRRFVDTARMRAVRQSVNATERLQEALLAEALDSLREVKAAHFELEQIYSSAMDFSQKEDFTKKFCNSLFHLQTD